MTFVFQIRISLIVMACFCFVRTFIHSWDHGFDVVFDIRFFQSTVLLGFAGVVAAIEQLLKYLQSQEPAKKMEGSGRVHYYQSLDMAPSPVGMTGNFIYIKDDQRVYVSDGAFWLAVK